MVNDTTPNRLILCHLILLFIDQKLPHTKQLLSSIAYFAEAAPGTGRPRIDSYSCFRQLCEDFCSSNSKISRRSSPKLTTRSCQITTSRWHHSLSSIKSPDNLYEWCKALALNLSQVVKDCNATDSLSLSPRGLAGSFARRTSLSIQLLSYSEFGGLFLAFEQFMQGDDAPSIASSVLLKAQRVEYDEKNSFDEKHIADHPEYYVDALTKRQLSTIASVSHPISAELKESYFSFNSFVGSSPVVSYEDAASESLLGAPNHYLRYLWLLHDGDYHASFDALHQHFDWMVSSGSKVYYHLALIAKAALHASFGEEQKAFDTLEEAAFVAREQNDEVALTFVLTWLFQMQLALPREIHDVGVSMLKSERLLEFLLQKGEALSPSFAPAVLLFEYEYALSFDAEPRRCFEAMSKSLYCSLCNGSMMLHKVADRASVHWLHAGYPVLAESYIDVSKLGEDKANRKKSFDVTKCKLMYWRGQSGDVLAEIGEVMSLDDIDCGLASMDHTWRLIFTIKIMMRDGQYRLAKELLTAVKGSPIKDSSSRREIAQLHMLMLLRTSNTRDGLMKLSSNLDSFQRVRNLHDSISCLLMKAVILKKARRWGSAFAMLIQVIRAASKFGIFTFIVEAAVKLTSLIETSEDKEKVMEVSLALVPLLHRCDNIELSSNIYLQLARLSINYARRLDTIDSAV